MGTYVGSISIRESVIALLDEIEDTDLELEQIVHRIDAAHSLRAVDDLAAIALTAVGVIGHLTDDAKALEAALMVREGHKRVLPAAALRGELAFASLTNRMRARAQADQAVLEVLG